MPYICSVGYLRPTPAGVVQRRLPFVVVVQAKYAAVLLSLFEHFGAVQCPTLSCSTHAQKRCRESLARMEKRARQRGSLARLVAPTQAPRPALRIGAKTRPRNGRKARQMRKVNVNVNVGLFKAKPARCWYY